MLYMHTTYSVMNSPLPAFDFFFAIMVTGVETGICCHDGGHAFALRHCAAIMLLPQGHTCMQIRGPPRQVWRATGPNQEGYMSREMLELSCTL